MAGFFFITSDYLVFEILRAKESSLYLKVDDVLFKILMFYQTTKSYDDYGFP